MEVVVGKAGEVVVGKAVEMVVVVAVVVEVIELRGRVSVLGII